MSLPLYKTEEGIWFQHLSPRWRVREEWTQASPEERENMEKYQMVMEPDIPYGNRASGTETTSI